MCETSSRWSMKSYQMELLRQDNSALLARVVQLEQELSQSQETAKLLDSIDIELAATAEGAHWAVVDLVARLRKSLPPEALSDEVTSAQLSHSLLRLQNGLRLATEFHRSKRPGGVWAGTPKKTVWSYLSSIFRAKRKDRSSAA